tara:strand:- start:856 stop:1671 length:816 start_codon:yes stop_codon:yes gene_type:complete
MDTSNKISVAGDLLKAVLLVVAQYFFFIGSVNTFGLDSNNLFVNIPLSLLVFLITLLISIKLTARWYPSINAKKISISIVIIYILVFSISLITPFKTPFKNLSIFIYFLLHGSYLIIAYFTAKYFIQHNGIPIEKLATTQGQNVKVLRKITRLVAGLIIIVPGFILLALSVIFLPMSGASGDSLPSELMGSIIYSLFNIVVGIIIITNKRWALWMLMVMLLFLVLDILFVVGYITDNLTRSELPMLGFWIVPHLMALPILFYLSVSNKSPS